MCCVLRNIRILKRLGAVLIASLIGSGCVQMAMQTDIQNLDRRFAAGEISEADYSALRAQKVEALNYHIAAVNAMVAGASTPMPQSDGGGYPVYVQYPQRTPGGGYTPQPMSTYVQAPQRVPGGGYTPQPT